MRIQNKMRIDAKTNLSMRKLLTLAMLTATLLFAAPRAAADDPCYRRTVHAEHKLHEAIERHGYYSRQANHWREELHEARERCWRERQQWWNEHDHRWHRAHDWDDHDHDRD
jgi:hypothetical protein